MNKRWRNVGLYVLAVITVIFIGTSVFDKPKTENATKTLRYSDFIEAVQDKEVSRVLLSPDSGTAQVVENDGSRSEVNLAPDKDLLKILTENDVDIAVTPTKLANPWQQAISSLIFPVLLIGGLFFLFRRSQNGSGGGGGNPAMSFGKSKARLQMEPSTQVTFSDVAGVEGAKLELTEVVDFLKSPDRFTAVGAKIPKGVLLVGPPGTGKTLLAKAVAGEAGVPFFSISGSEFVEMFVGVGASRVRDLFEQAKKNAPCIVFIDEIDAVGRQRGAGMGGGNDEREQTLNQLLTEMDGFEGNTGIIVIAATNRVDILDSALLRPGRFDRQITVNLPDLEGRMSILKVHARNKNFADDVSIKNLAQRTVGFAGADLANVLNEAAILAARGKKEKIGATEVSTAIDRIITGLEGTCLRDSRSKRLVAYHEIGHALTGTLLKNHDPVEKVTLVPRGQAAGLTWFTPVEDQGLISRGQILARMIGTLGGRAAEEVIFGSTEVTTGASSDIMQVTGMARQMVTRYGMSKVGPMAFEVQQQQQMMGQGSSASGIAPETAAKIDQEVQNIVTYCHNEARDLINKNRAAVDRLTDELLLKETISGIEFREILAEYTAIPEKTDYVSYFDREDETVKVIA